MSDDSEEDLLEKPTTTPQKSKRTYECTYNKFMKWRQEQNIDTFTEDILLQYFIEMSKTMKSPTLWACYSMLKSELQIKNNVQIEKYRKLYEFIKKSYEGYKPKQAKTFTKQQLLDFFHNAPNEKYLGLKVILIFALFGECNSNELVRMKTTDVEDLGKLLFVKVQHKSNCTPVHSFAITGKFYLNLYRKYLSLRPKHAKSSRLFVKYYDGKCRRGGIGRNKFCSLSRDVAAYLKLPSLSDYTSYSFRKSSKDFFADDNNIQKRQNFTNSSLNNQSETVIIRNGVEVNEQQSDFVTIKDEIEVDEEELSSVMSDDMDTNMSLDNVDEIMDNATVNNGIKVENCSEDEEQLESDKESDTHTISGRKNETIDVTMHGLNFKLNYCTDCTFNITISNKND